ncbi:MAG TPA: histidine phosphatase family protein [Anaerolineales bacterium]|nr:histidine phosphatase family protein [Anaerolineales bacterium]
MTTVYLIRHGTNDWLGRRLPGWSPDLHLNPLGMAQAEALVGLLREVRFEAIYSSPLPRAVETARPLARARRLPVRRRVGLAEMKVGSWQGQPLRRLRRRKLWPVIQFTPSRARFPGGESFVEANARVVGELEALRRAHPSRRSAIACFSHGDIIKLAVAHVLGLPLDLFQRIVIEPASITVVHFSEGHAVVRSLNDTRAAEAAGHG